ncbi:MAG: hypothetical protein L0K86_29105 [Actinomycetia bacterium]|nr:hypothetical protein [Actinomycetes bacterium]
MAILVAACVAITLSVFTPAVALAGTGSTVAVSYAQMVPSAVVQGDADGYPLKPCGPANDGEKVTTVTYYIRSNAAVSADYYCTFLGELTSLGLCTGTADGFG